MAAHTLYALVPKDRQEQICKDIDTRLGTFSLAIPAMLHDSGSKFTVTPPSVYTNFLLQEILLLCVLANPSQETRFKIRVSMKYYQYDGLS